MFSSPDSRHTKSPTLGNDRPLHPTNTAKLLSAVQSGQLDTSTTSTKLPIIIPASTKRKRTEPLEHTIHHRRHFVLPYVFLGIRKLIILPFLLFIPMDNN